MEGIEPTSLDYRSRALPLSYTAKLGVRRQALRDAALQSLVDPTGLKPAPHGLKIRRSVTRAPSQEHFQLPISDCRLVARISLVASKTNRQLAIGNVLAVAEGFEPSHGRINNAVPYQLGYATKKWLREQESNLPVLAYETYEPPLLYSRAIFPKFGGDEGSRTLIVRFTRPTLFLSN